MTRRPNTGHLSDHVVMWLIAFSYCSANVVYLLKSGKKSAMTSRAEKRLLPVRTCSSGFISGSVGQVRGVLAHEMEVLWNPLRDFL